MRLLKESNEFSLDWESDSQIPYWLFEIGTEALLTTVIDGIKCYCIDKITEIRIKEEGVFYYFEESEMKVSERDLLPYTIDNELILKDLGYEYMRSGYAFSVLYDADFRRYKK